LSPSLHQVPALAVDKCRQATGSLDVSLKPIIGARGQISRRDGSRVLNG